MAKHKITKAPVKATPVETLRAGVRFSPTRYYRIEDGGDNLILHAEVDGEVTDYNVKSGGGGGYEEVLLWENPQPDKGLKVDTLLTGDDFYVDEYEYFKFTYKNMNSTPELIDFYVTFNDLYNRYFNFGLVSTGDTPISDEYEARYIYIRQVWFDGNMGGIMCSGHCNELSPSFTDKNFRAVPIYLYGYKKEV